MADSSSFTANVTATSISVSDVIASTSVSATVTTGAKGDKGDKGDTGTTDYNELVNAPDLTLKADKATTYTKIEVDTSLAGKAELVHVHAIADTTGLQTALDGKVSKVTTVNTLYGVNGSGNQTSYLISQGSDTSSIAQRSSGGTLTVGTPTANAHATTKAYVDTEVSTLDSSLATVAKTGSYNDLSNKPTIPSIAGLATEAQVQNVQDNLDSHEADTANPHSVTKAQVGLGNVENLAPADMPVSTATQTALNGKVDKTGDNLIIGASAPTPAVGEKVLWLNTTGGNITLNLVTGD